MPIQRLKDFIKLESKSSALLLGAVFFAIFLANSPWRSFYENLIEYPLHFSGGPFEAATSLKLIVNDGLMTIFFLLISLEVKRGFLVGELNSIKKAALPLIASLGGILSAAMVYLLIHLGLGGATSIKGWAIPTATDIAFSSAILLLLGRAVPRSLRLLLTTLAIIDDLLAIFIIAIFYSVGFQIFYLLLGIFCFLGLFLLNRFRLLGLYGQIGLSILLWFCILKSNVSPPLAGVLIGLTVPLGDKKREGYSPLQNLEAVLHPWVSFGILPLFVFVNGGLNLLQTNFAMFYHPLTLGIIAGLFLGKQGGVFAACWFSTKAKLTHLPDGLSWQQIYGMSVLTGIGFTMNLFIGFLAFPNDLDSLNMVKLGIFTGSFLSAVVGFFILKRTLKRK
ncbi:MAG TPA: Na+/H+ antiporter NhaA [Gammaproteobacteria bacterium]|nr:Na+/H+ antiporter NhaA [Gammaproteobacteria bacterium]